MLAGQIVQAPSSGFDAQGGGDGEGHGDCNAGTYRQVPHPNNGRTSCDGLTRHEANVDINPAVTDHPLVVRCDAIFDLLAYIDARTRAAPAADQEDPVPFDPLNGLYLRDRCPPE